MAAMAGSYSGAAALTPPQRLSSSVSLYSSASSSSTCRFYGERVFVSKYLQWSPRRKGGRDSRNRTPIIVCPKAVSDSKTSQTCLDPKASKSVLGIILGGGAGTELYPLTKKRAKPAVPLGANYRLIDVPVSNCLNSDIAKIYVLTQFNSASLNRHLSIAYATTMGGYRNEGFVEVLAAQQSPENPNWFQGTADAIRQYIWLFEEHNVKEFLILSGDNLYRMDYEWLIEAHRETNADITIGAIPIDDRHADHSSSGDLLKIDGEGRVVGFCEKHDLNKGGYIQRSMGIYVVNKDVMLNLLRQLLPHSNDLRTEVIPGAISSGMNVQTYLFHGYWEDIGTIESFYNANMAITKRPTPDFSFYDRSSPIYTQPRYLPPSKMLDVDTKDSIIGEGCILQRCKIYHSIVGLRSCISEGVVIEDTLLMGADYYESEVDKKIIAAKGGVCIGIGRNSRIKRAIIDKNARIGDNTKIINVDGVEEAARETDGYFIKNGVRTCSRRLLSPLLQTNSSICRLIRPPLTFTTSIGNCPPSNSSSVPSPPRMEASVTEDFVHVSDPIIYSVYDDETGNDPNTLPSDDVVSHAPSNPEDFLKSVIRLECDSAAGEDGVCKVYLVGTAHVSKESCKEVQQVIESLKPEVVFLELCMSRIAVLNPPERFQAPTVREMIENLKGKDSNALGVLYAWLLAKIAGQLEVFPGAEFHVAFEEARNYGAKIILGDRPVQITLRRTWGKMPLWHKVKFVYRMLFQAMFIPSAADIQKMLNDIEDEDMITLLIQEMSKEFPTIMETLVYERDMFMSSKLLEVASNHSSVVAVVGKGHLSGIKKHWKKPIELDLIMEIPPSSSFPNMAAILSLGVIGAAIISGVYIFRKS